MAYKRNPINRCERIASLAKFVIANSQNGSLVEMTQWFERTLDDSANKRLSIRHFLALDAILDLMLNIFENVVVYEKDNKKKCFKRITFYSNWKYNNGACRQGKDRQKVHECIKLFNAINKNVKLELENNLIVDLLKQDEVFKE